MSSVTSTILILNYSENRGNRLIKQINDYFQNERSEQHDKAPFVNVSEYTGGTKGMWGEIWTKSCNYLNLEHFLDFLVSLKWYYPEQSQILVHREYANDNLYHHKVITDLLKRKEWPEVQWNWTNTCLPHSKDFMRAAGGCVCEACGKTYIKHRYCVCPENLSYDGTSALHVICDGRLVKL